MNINKVMLMGRLTADPELRMTTTNVPVLRFTIAINRKFNNNETDFLDCVAFNKTAEFVNKYFKKGSVIIVFGSIQTGTYEKDDKKIKTTSIIAEEVQFGESKKTENKNEDYGKDKNEDFEEYQEEELPF